MGAVSLISKQPGPEMNGYILAGGGNFGQKRTEAAVNIPVAEDLLYIRAAGIYNSRDGYIKDTTGMLFNGDNTMGGRLSVRLLPAFRHQIDLKLEYLKDDEPAVAFRNAWIPSMNGETGLSDNTVQLNGSDSKGAVNKLMDATLNYKLFRDEHTYLSLISSYRIGKASLARDADGTSLPAIFMESESNTSLFFQELRYNFSRRSRTNGSLGINYIHTGSEGTGRMKSNDTYLFDLLHAPGSFVMPGESRYPFNPVPLNPSPMSGINLPGDHAEEVLYNNKDNSLQAWLHFDHQLTGKIFFNAGVRGAYDRIKISRESVYSGGSQSELGQYSGADPNLLYAPGAPVSIKKSHLYVTGKAGFTYRWNEDFNIFINAIRGRRPGIIQFTWDNQSPIPDAEILNSLEGGVKLSVLERVFLDVTGHYRQHNNAHTLLWGGARGTGLNAAAGKAKSHGLDAGVQVALLKGFNMFGSYSWLNAVFDSTDTEGRDFIYAGNSFAFLPRHSFTTGVNINLEILPSVSLFANSWYSWRSHFWFSEANTPGIEQSAYGILNASAGLKLAKPEITFTVYGSNLLDENYILSAGHWGSQFGLPTFVNGSPRMLGVKMLWEF
jgi:iron complex outermembrane recepter protein